MTSKNAKHLKAFTELNDILKQSLEEFAFNAGCNLPIDKIGTHISISGGGVLSTLYIENELSPEIRKALQNFLNQKLRKANKVSLISHHNKLLEHLKEEIEKQINDDRERIIRIILAEQLHDLKNPRAILDRVIARINQENILTQKE